MSRSNRKAFNKEEQYKEVFEERGVDKIEQFRTPKLKNLSDKFSCYEYVWKQGDTFWRLSFNAYGTIKYWYIIAQLNNKPTESHVKIGETIKIPFNINELVKEINS